MSRTSIRATVALFSMTLCGTIAQAQTHVTTFTNSAPITIGTAVTQNPALSGNPYPSVINVAGVAGVTYHMSVTLVLTHESPADLDILLVAPNGAAVLLLSDVGSGGALAGTRIVLDTWGAPASSGLGDIDVPADYDGDGVTDVAVYRQATGEWFIRKSFDGGVQQVSFGAPSSLGLGDTPIPSDYDGDGLADLAIFRAATAQWFLRSSAGFGVGAFTFGSSAAGDNPAR
jgi:hypothetical protein